MGFGDSRLSALFVSPPGNGVPEGRHVVPEGLRLRSVRGRICRGRRCGGGGGGGGWSQSGGSCALRVLWWLLRSAFCGWRVGFGKEKGK